MAMKSTSLFLVSLLLGSTGANATSVTYDFTYSGANLPSNYFSLFGSGGLNNTAQASGSFTLSDSALLNSSITWFPNSQITAFTMTVSGATAGNGTFTLGNLGAIEAYADVQNVARQISPFLNTQIQLVGQRVPGDLTAWGVPPNLNGPAGDFVISFNGAPAPTQNDYYTLKTAGGQEMTLTSLAPVPLPAAAWLLLSGLGGLGLFGQRRLARLNIEPRRG